MRPVSICSWWLVALFSMLCFSSAHAQAEATASDPVLQSMRQLLAIPEATMDLAKAKLAIDRVMDPNLDTRAVAKELDRWAALVRSRYPAGANNRAKLDILLSTLYQPGPWNDQRPFRYNLDDPFGANLRTKLLSTYLAARKGNCVSMPILFAILGQRLGLPVTLATAPQHAMVKYLDDNGQWLNVEATAGGFKYDSSYIRETGITEKALQNDIYLRPLTRRESVVVMLSTLMEFYGQQGPQERRLELARMGLKVDPKNVDAMMHMGAGYYLLLRDRFMRPYPDPTKIPVGQQAEFRWLSQENLRWQNRAEELGWTAPTPAQDAKYLESIKREKATQGTQQ